MYDSDMLVALGAVGLVFAVIALVIYVLTAIAFWKIFTKAGKPGWHGIIPILNVWDMVDLAWNSTMAWVVIGLDIVGAILSYLQVPVLPSLMTLAGFILMILAYNKLSKAFGHGTGFTVGLVLLNVIFLLILAFENSTYLGRQDGNTPAQDAVDTASPVDEPTDSSNNF